MLQYLTVLDVAINPIEEFAYSLRQGWTPVILIIAGLISVISLTVFFIKNRDDKAENEDKKD